MAHPAFQRARSPEERELRREALETAKLASKILDIRQARSRRIHSKVNVGSAIAAAARSRASPASATRAAEPSCRKPAGPALPQGSPAPSRALSAAARATIGRPPSGC